MANIVSHLRFADSILICSNTPLKLEQMLPEFADESENQGLKMNKSKTKAIIENDTQVENVESYTSSWDRDTVPETKTKTRIFKEEARLDGQHSPSTATSSNR